MKLVPLDGGTSFAKVDDEDLEYIVSMGPWFSHNGYAYTDLNKEGRHKHRSRKMTIKMEHLLLKVSPGREIDHKDGDRKNNQKDNLREATHSQNMANMCLRYDSQTGVKGVSFNKNRNKYEAHITVNYKKIHLGFFVTLEEATKVRDAAAKRYFGEFATTNLMLLEQRRKTSLSVFSQFDTSSFDQFDSDAN